MAMISQLATPDPIQVLPQTPVFEAARRMADFGVGDVIVTDETTGAVMGMVTDRDLTVRVLARNLDAGTTPVGDICTTDVTTVPATADVAAEKVSCATTSSADFLWLTTTDASPGSSPSPTSQRRATSTTTTCATCRDHSGPAADNNDSPSDPHRSAATTGRRRQLGDADSAAAKLAVRAITPRWRRRRRRRSWSFRRLGRSRGPGRLRPTGSGSGKPTACTR